MSSNRETYYSKMNDLAGSIAEKASAVGDYTIDELRGLANRINTHSQPESTISITQQGITDVYNYAYANVEDIFLRPENVKAGVTILGVTGTAVVSGGITPTGSTVIYNLNPKDVTNYASARVNATNILSENIKAGVTILGVEGSFAGFDLEDADAVAGDILSGKFAFSYNGKIEGTMPVKSGADVTASNNVVTIPAGYYSSQVVKTIGTNALGATTYTPTTVNQTIATDTYTTGVQTILGDPNLVPENIKEDVYIFGVLGTHSGGGGGDEEAIYGRLITEAYGDKSFSMTLSDISDPLYLKVDGMATTSDYDMAIPAGATGSHTLACRDYVTIVTDGTTPGLRIAIGDCVGCSVAIFNNGVSVNIDPTATTASFSVSLTE